MPNIHEKLESKPNNFGSQGEGVAGAYITLSTLGTTRKRINISHNSPPSKCCSYCFPHCTLYTGPTNMSPTI